MGLMFDTPNFELHASNRPLITKVAIAMMILSFLAVCLRFLARRMVQQPWLLDDWIIVLALPLSWIICILEITAAKDGLLGQHVYLSTPSTLKQFFRDLYAVQLLYSFSIALTKLSILVFYRRIFISNKTRIPLFIIGGIVAAWLIATALIAIFSCAPIDYFWNKTDGGSGKCINTDIYFMAGGATNIATDVAILIFPLPIIWKLQIFRTQKLSILGIFLLGGFIILVSCLRLVAIVEAKGNTDFTWAFLPLAVWTTIETNVAIFCACIPSMRPLLRLSVGKPVYTGNNESNVDFTRHARVRVHETWWSSVRSVPSQDNNDVSFLWLEESNEEPLHAHGTKTVISSSGIDDRVQLQELELPAAMRDGIYVEQVVVWD